MSQLTICQRYVWGGRGVAGVPPRVKYRPIGTIHPRFDRTNRELWSGFAFAFAGGPRNCREYRKSSMRKALFKIPLSPMISIAEDRKMGEKYNERRRVRFAR